MPIICRFRDCKAFLVASLTRVSSAVASTRFYFLALSSVIETAPLYYCHLSLDMGLPLLEVQHPTFEIWICKFHLLFARRNFTTLLHPYLLPSVDATSNGHVFHVSSIFAGSIRFSNVVIYVKNWISNNFEQRKVHLGPRPGGFPICITLSSPATTSLTWLGIRTNVSQTRSPTRVRDPVYDRTTYSGNWTCVDSYQRTTTWRRGRRTWLKTSCWCRPLMSYAPVELRCIYSVTFRRFAAVKFIILFSTAWAKEVSFQLLSMSKPEN